MAVNNNCVDPAEENGEARDAGINELEDFESDLEYERLNTALDEISNCLDALEKQNDTLQEKLKELLKSNQEAAHDESMEVSDLPAQDS